MSEETQSESADMEMEIELPPALVQFLNMLQADQKKLLKDKSFSNPDQLRKFISLTLMERFVQAVEMLGTTMYDLHTLAVSNATQLQRQRQWTAKHLRKLGAEVSDGEAFAAVGTDQVNALGQALYALGSHLGTKYPSDKDTEAKFNEMALAYNQLVAALMGDQSVEDDDDEDEDEGDGEEEQAADEVGEEAADVDETAGSDGGDQP
jgi:hypothetical protein